VKDATKSKRSRNKLRVKQRFVSWTGFESVFLG